MLFLHLSEVTVNNYENLNLADIVTPVDVSELQTLLKWSGYNKDKANYLIEGFTYGFKLNYQGNLRRKNRTRNIPFTVGDKFQLWEKIQKEVSLGRFAGPFEEIPFEYYIQSPIGLVPKAGNQTRLIFHLSFDFGEEPSVNACTPEEDCSVKYRDLDYAVKKMLQILKLITDGHVVIWFGKTDLKSAFRILGMHPSVWWTMIMTAEHPINHKWVFFVDKCLPFGHSMSCALFQEFSNALDHILNFIVMERSINQAATTNYLDDFLFIALTMMLCNYLLEQFLLLCKHLNVPLSKDKTEWASTMMVFLGILLNGTHHILAVPQEKKDRALHLLRSLINRKKATVKELQQLAGLLNFINHAIVPGRAFTRRMYAKFAGCVKFSKAMQRSFNHHKHEEQSTFLKPHHHIRLDGEFKRDCKMWETFLSSGNNAICRPFIDLNETLSADQLSFFMDAAKGSDLGFGGIFNNHWIIGQWESDFIKTNNQSIEFLELFGVVIAVYAWITELRNKRIVLFCDNESVVHMINNSSSSCRFCMVLIRKLVLKGLEFNTRIFAKWIAGSKNVFSDLLSRQKVSKFKCLAGKDIDPYPAKLHADLWPLSDLWREIQQCTS